MWNRLALLISLLAVVLVGCKTTSKDAWVKVVSRCALHDQVDPDKLLYFGPSNTVGPGSLWRKDTQGKGYALRLAEEKLKDNESLVYKDRSPAQCDGNYVSETDFGPKVSFVSALSPVSAEVGADFKRAKSVKVKAGQVKWYTVQEKEYEDYIARLPASDPLKQDIAKDNRFVMRRALQITGYTAELKFDSSVASELKGKYSGPLPAGVVGTVGASLNARWEEGGTLVLESQGPFFVAAELHPWKAGAFAAGKLSLSPDIERVGKDQVPVSIDTL